VSDARLEDIESRVAFVDQAVAELQETVDLQQRQILELEQRCQTLALRLADALEDRADGDGADERPPHY
jgi:SlyX protein